MPRISVYTGDCHCEACHTTEIANGNYCLCDDFQSNHPEQYQSAIEANEAHEQSIRTREWEPFVGYMEECQCAWCKAWRLYSSMSEQEYNFEEFVRIEVRVQMPLENQVTNICRLCGIYHADKGRIGIGQQEWYICRSCFDVGPIAYCPDCEKYGHVSVLAGRIRPNDLIFPYAQGTGWRETTPCEHCIDNYSVTVCDQCDRTFVDGVSDDLRYVESRDESWCDDCVSEHAMTCEQCGELSHSEDSSYIRNTGYCCEGCTDDAEFCEDCDEHYLGECGCYDDIVRNYSYRPDPIFLYNPKRERVDNTVFFGVELELENMGGLSNGRAAMEIRNAFESSVVAEDCETYGGCSNLLYFKKDATVRTGFECVSHPFSWYFLKRHKKAFESLFEQVKQSGFGRQDNCGMHVHISKEPFSRLETYKLARFLFGNPFFTERVSNRKEDRFRSQANVYGETKKELLLKSRHKTGGGRNCLNLNPPNTMELRMFDSVDSFDDFMRNIEFVEAVCRFVKETSMKSLWPNLLMEYVSERKKTFPHVHRFFQNTLF